MNFVFDYTSKNILDNIKNTNKECVIVTRHQDTLKVLFNFPSNRFQNFNMKKQEFIKKLNATEDDKNIICIQDIKSYRIISMFYEIFC